MKLLDRQEIDKGKALDRKREIDEGVKLAKKVDSLRETSQKEEGNLKKFRDSSLKAIQSELAVEVAKLDALKQQNQALSEERIKLQAPIDLTEEWEKVTHDKLDIEVWKRDLFDREAALITREIAIRDFPEREKAIAEKERKAELYLQETNKSYDKVEGIRLEIEEKRKVTEEELSLRQSLLKEKEDEMTTREFKFGKEQERLVREEKEVLDRGTSFIARESVIEAKTKELFEREETLKENENLTNRYLAEANENYDKTEKTRLEIERQKEDSSKDIKEQYRVLTEKQKELGFKERDLNLEREHLEQEKVALANERLHITSQQETLKIAWQNIKNITK